MYSEQMNTATQTLTEADIEIKEPEQEELYIRKDGFGELSKRMQESNDYLKNNKYKLINVYTWTEGKKKKCAKWCNNSIWKQYSKKHWNPYNLNFLYITTNKIRYLYSLQKNAWIETRSKLHS